MSVVARSLDDLDRLAFRLSRTVRTQFPYLLTQGFTLADLEERLLPYREVRREMADSGPDAFETTLLRLVAGERGYLQTDQDLQEASRQALASPAPTLALVGEWATTSLHLGDLSGADERGASAANGASGTRGDRLADQGSIAGAGAIGPTSALDVFPAPVQNTTHSPRSTAGGTASGSVGTVQRVTPARGSRAAHPHCRFCDCRLPVGRTVTYCPHCGMDLTKRHCQACSTELEASWRYCVTCGRGS